MTDEMFRKRNDTINPTRNNLGLAHYTSDLADLRAEAEISRPTGEKHALLLRDRLQVERGASMRFLTKISMNGNLN